MHKVVKINTNTEVLVLQQLEKEIVSLELKIKLMQQLTTASGFFSFYFDKLKNHLSCEDCFLYLIERKTPIPLG